MELWLYGLAQYKTSPSLCVSHIKTNILYWNDKGLPIWTAEGTIRTKLSLSGWKSQALLWENRNKFAFCKKSLPSLDVYKLGACLQRLALCPFIGFPHLRHLACFLCFVVGASIVVWVLDCKTSCCWPERKQKQKKETWRVHNRQLL